MHWDYIAFRASIWDSARARVVDRGTRLWGNASLKTLFDAL